jgi:hypothetical protein
MANQLKNKKAHEVTDTEMRALNWKRESMVGKEMTLSELKETLRTLNLPTNQNFITVLVGCENPPIIRMERGKYCFNPKPVHIDKMKLVWKNYGSYGNRKAMKAEQTSLDILIKDAIALLKNNGYKVFKPVTEYKEV